MNQNLRWLEDDSDSDESNAAVDENGEKKKNRSSEEKGGKAKSNTPPLPDTYVVWMFYNVRMKLF